jgi:hypothetical protein
MNSQVGSAFTIYAAVVTFSGYDPELLGQLDESAASPAQFYLLQKIIRSIEPDTLLSQHAAALAGMAAELPRAQAALLSHSERLQPGVTLLKALCQNGAMTVAKSAAFRPRDQLLIDISSTLAKVPTATAINNESLRRAAAATLASELDPLIQRIPALLVSMFTEAWSLSNYTSRDWEFLDHVSDELACLVALTDRDVSTLQEQLKFTVAREGLDHEAVLHTLLPTPAEHYVACVIRGAGHFYRLAALEPSAQQWSRESDEDIRWGLATNRLRSFLAKMTVTAEDCIVSVTVQAVDKASAARLGRRKVTELLDQYVAGHRLIHLSLRAETLVARAGVSNDTQEWQPRHRGVRRAYPLLDHWPEGLRETLRMAHIARVTDSPMTATALSWAAIEACGLKHQQSKRLGRALSLQALRQQIVESHQEFLQSAAASIRHANTQINNAAELVGKYKRGLARCPVHIPAHAHIETLLRSAMDRLAKAENRGRELAEAFDDAISAINQYAVVDERNHLTDVNSWVDILLPERACDSVQLKAAREALDAIIPNLSPLASTQVLDWRRRLSTPTQCVEWLSATQGRLETLLDALYGARNLALHSGIFATTGDAVLGQGAIMLVDFTLEFLGNWYKNISPPSYETPTEVIVRLADRQIHLIRRLNTHTGAPYALNAGRLTSPSTTDAWDRS